MKCRRSQLVLAALGAEWLSSVAALGKAVHYARAAQKDERKHCEYAAAMEWRLAAELFDTDTPVADYCWRQWERIMQLPRRLSTPITDSPLVVMRPASAPPRADEVSVPIAA